MRKAVLWSSFGTGTMGFVLGTLLTQAPGRDHSLDLTFLVGSAALLGVATWMLLRANRGNLGNIALTVAVLEVATAAYFGVSILTYRR